ncbi:hypothetical protein WN944_027019 [Citrus x changshan-huyou]|uniref:Uncharacterized protein n=1 Tax=Citrus x changshan-huyou TaxID=2935761 RepID=A0AAP0LJZ5_9ROSI
MTILEKVTYLFDAILAKSLAIKFFSLGIYTISISTKNFFNSLSFLRVRLEKMARYPYLIPLIIGEFNYQISDSLYFVRGAMSINDVKLDILVHDFVDGRIIFACAGRFIVGVRMVSALSEGFTVAEEMVSTLLGRFYEGEEMVSSLLGVFSVCGLGNDEFP